MSTHNIAPRPWDLTRTHIVAGDGRAWPIATAPRDVLMAFCVWNDRNGCFTDEDCTLEFGAPVSTDNLREVVVEWAADSI